VNKSVHWCKLKERREWRAFLEENRKLVQLIDDHPKTEKAQI